ncbi:MAG: hypothetical protein L0I76_31080 [Pseudonocardia sp.]|nr:hypothetical protein [Pseudonocardia sp.]
MNQHSVPPLSEDQLREPPVVHLAIGMIAAELDLSCVEALDLLHERAVDGARSLAAAAQDVVDREIIVSGDGRSAAPRWGRRSSAVGRGRWAIRNAQDLVGRERAGRRGGSGTGM